MSLDEKYRVESLEAFLLFAIPLFLGIYLFLQGFIEEVSRHYLIYPVYIVGSLALTKYNGRRISEIGSIDRSEGSYPRQNVSAALTRSTINAEVIVYPSSAEIRATTNHREENVI